MNQRSQTNSLPFFFGLIPFQFFLDRIHTFFQTAGGDPQSLGGNIAGLIGIHTAKFKGINAGGLGQHVNGAFNRKGCLGIAVAAHGLGIGIVGIDTFGFIADIRHPIEGCNRHHHHRWRRSAPGGISTVVKDHRYIPEKEFAIFITTLRNVGNGGLTGGGGNKLFGAIEFDFHRSACVKSQQYGDILIGIGVQLAAKAPADARFDHPNPAIL